MASAQLTEEARALDNDIKVIFLDGHVDKTKTLTFNRETGKFHQSLINEEHYTLMQEPEGRYLHHFMMNGIFFSLPF